MYDINPFSTETCVAQATCPPKHFALFGSRLMDALLKVGYLLKLKDITNIISSIIHIIPEFCQKSLYLWAIVAVFLSEHIVGNFPDKGLHLFAYCVK